jgi:hypothetical protein
MIQMRERIVESCYINGQNLPVAMILRLVRDPLRHAAKSGRFRANPILVLLAVIVSLTAGTFLIFSFGAK